MATSKMGMTDALTSLVEATDVRGYNELTRKLCNALYELVRTRVVQLPPDPELGGGGLVIRVRDVLEEMGLTVFFGRKKLEDLVVSIPDVAKRSIPLVVEVKSGKASSPAKRDLRQLDDWVFDLSGESRNRQLGIQNQGRRRNWRSKGAEQAAPIAPDPHKGVLIYNGPLGTPLTERPCPILYANEKEFAKIRGFCVISMPCLLSWKEGCTESPETLKTFWSDVQECNGELSHFDG